MNPKNSMESQLVDDSAPSFSDSEAPTPPSPFVPIVELIQHPQKLQLTNESSPAFDSDSESVCSPALLRQVVEDTPDSEITKRGKKKKQCSEDKPSNSIAKKLKFDEPKLDDPSGTPRTRDIYREPLATSYHSRFLGTVDYIWHTEDLAPVRVLETLSIDNLRQFGGLPSKEWGSDHLALVCELAFLGDCISDIIKNGLIVCAGKVFSEVIKAIRYPSERDLQRFLAEGPSVNKLANSTSCDGVCQLKSSVEP